MSEENWTPFPMNVYLRDEKELAEFVRKYDDGVAPSQPTALERFNECGGMEEADPLERLRFFCSLAMNGQDWLDVEPFFDAVRPHGVAPSQAPSKEACAKCSGTDEKPWCELTQSEWCGRSNPELVKPAVGVSEPRHETFQQGDADASNPPRD